MSLARFPGVEVQLVERASFPRKKACGSGLSPWCLELLDGMGLGPAVAKEAFHIGAARIGGPRGPVLELRSKYEAKVLCRSRFDELLAQEAVRRGATLREGTRVREIVRNGTTSIRSCAPTTAGCFPRASRGSTELTRPARTHRSDHTANSFPLGSAK